MPEEKLHNHSFELTVDNSFLNTIVINTNKHWKDLTNEDFLEGLIAQLRRDVKRCNVNETCFSYLGSFTPGGFQQL